MPYIRFLAGSGLPLTERDVVRFLHWFSVEIQRHYRTTATQKRTKPTLDTHDSVVGHLRDAASRRREKTYLRATESLDGFVKDYQVGAILYREVRSGAIHSFEFDVNDDRFFAEPDLFVDTVRRGYDTTVYLSVEFSAAWLLDLLRDCLRNYKERLKASRRLPPALWGEICDPDRELEMFDDSLLEASRDIGFAVGR
jgi:hypothetical protein